MDNIITNVALISINETMVVQLVSFLIFLFIMNRIMFRPLRNAMDDRRDYIARIQSDIKKADKGYDDVSDQIRKQESAARAEALAINAEHESAGTVEAVNITGSMREEIAVLRKKTEAEVNAQLVEARKTIQKESEILAATIMEKVLERRLSS
ncbi:MAG: ATP synthase F0 subunit B [Desulfobacterales bacterium]|nr:ATP synthase F0 subunit B [Desulfobacterales bacterium]